MKRILVTLCCFMSAFASVHLRAAAFALGEIVVTSSDLISGFEFFNNGLFWWSTDGNCTPELQKFSKIGVLAAGAGGERLLASDCGSGFRYVVRDDAYVYFVDNGRHFRKALNATPLDPAQLLPTHITAGFQLGALMLWNGRLYWTQSNGSYFDVFSVNPDGTDQQYFMLGTGNGVKKMSVFTYGPFSSSQTTALCVLTPAGDLLSWDINPRGPPVVTLANGVSDFTIRKESRFVPGSPISRFTTVYAIRARKELITVTVGSQATSVIYAAEGDNELQAVAVDSRNVYLVEQPILCDPICRADGHKIFRQNRPPDDLAHAGNWGLISWDPVGSGASTDYLYNLRSNEQNFYWIQGRTIRWLSTSAPELEVDFRAVGVEVVQTTQDMDNSARLVAQKQTLVRGYATVTLNPPGAGPFFPSARLRGTLSGEDLGTISPINNTTVDGTTDLAILRGNLNRSFLFELPKSWVQRGLLTLDFEVNHNKALPETVTAANPFPANNNHRFAFDREVIQMGSPRLVTVPIHTLAPNYWPNAPDSGFGEILTRASSLLPVAKLSPFPRTDRISKPVPKIKWTDTLIPLPYPAIDYEPFDVADGLSAALFWLGVYATFDSDPSKFADTHYVGTIHSTAGSTGGKAYRPVANILIPVLVVKMEPPGAVMNNPVWNEPRGGRTLAHELGHNYTLTHVDQTTSPRGCGGTQPEDAGYYPYDSCTIGIKNSANVAAELSSWDTQYGFDPLTRSILKPTDVGDLMSYRDSRWLSKYSLDVLFGRIPGLVPASREAMPAAVGPDIVLFISGTLAWNEQRMTIGPCYRLPATTFDPGKIAASMGGTQPVAAGWRVRLVDSNSALLGEAPLALQVPEDGHETEANVLQFVTDHPRLNRIQILRGTDLIAERVVSMHSPTLALDTPVVDAAEQTIALRWTASDLDGDPLLFTIQYSPDNLSWQTLQVAYPALSVRLNSRMLRGSGQARVRVIATDGANSTIATSVPFVLAPHAPEVAIDGVKEGERLPFGSFRYLHGLALDAEDGSLPDGALRWNLSGPHSQVGTGDALSLVDLSPGHYTATLNAADSDTQSSQATRQFQILPAVIPQAGASPVLDGKCADAAYTDALFVRLALGNGEFARVRLAHFNTDLYISFTDLKYATGTSSKSSVGFRVDANDSRETAAQPDDFGFFVDQDGIPFQEIGNGSTLVVTLSPRLGFSAVVNRGETTWSAEFRIADSLFGGWNHAAGIMLSHQSLVAASDDRHWPPLASPHQPATWAAAYFGTPSSLFNAAPVANAGPSGVYNILGALTIYLDGTTSFDPDGSPLSYAWTQLEGPPVALQNANTATPHFDVAASQSLATLRFRLVVGDGAATSAPSETDVVLRPAALPPIAPLPAASVQTDGSVTLRLTWPGRSGDRVVIQASSDLLQWVSIETNTVDYLPVIVVHDSQAGIYHHRFYRLASTPTEPSCLAAPSGLVGWWRAEGDATDDTGSNHGALLAGLDFGSGKVGRALNFTSADQNLVVPASPSLDVGALSGMTLEAWINPADAVNEAPVAEWGDNSGFGAHLWVNVAFGGVGGPGALYASARFGDLSYFASTPGIVLPNVWQHVAFAYDKASGICRLYHNGVEVASKDIGANPPQTAFNLNLGHRVGGPSFRGLLDDVALYNRALSLDEIRYVYLVGNAGKCGPVCGDAAAPVTQNFEIGAPVNYALSQLFSAPAASVQNADAGSSGRFLRLLNDGVNDNINAITFNQTGPHLFQSMRAEFDFRFASVDAPADGLALMLIPTSVYGTTGPGFVTPLAFEEPNIPGVFAIGFDVHPRTEPRNDVSVHWNGVEYANVTLSDSSVNLTSASFHRALVTLRHVSGGALVTVSLVPDVNAAPLNLYTPVRDLFVPGLDPFSSRVEFAGRTGGLNMNVDLDNIRVQFLPFCLARPNPLPVPPAQVVYSNNFEGAVGAEWSVPQAVSTTPVGGRRFLGEFANNIATLQLASLPEHTHLAVSFDLFILKSWDGNRTDFGPDTFQLGVRGGPTLIRSTFSTYTTQSYPGALTDSFPANTGAVEINALGYTHPSLGPADAVYRLTATFNHTVPGVTLDFSGANLQDVGDESWGLDNVRVEAITLP